MPKTYTLPQPFSTEARPPIALTTVDSSQLHSLGYDVTTATLAIRFLAPGQRDKPIADREGGDAIYHYPAVSSETWDQFRTSESVGTFFGKHLKTLTFDKFHAVAAES